MSLIDKLKGDSCRHKILLHTGTMRTDSGSTIELFRCLPPPEYVDGIKYCGQQLVRKNPPGGYKVLLGWKQEYYMRCGDGHNDVS
jgi:hypothetical protein